MTGLSQLLQQSATHAWLFVPSAILLGALHGLEPGHSKTMMAAFIIAIRGTVLQATLLGLSATVSHTAVVWAVALSGLYFGRQWNGEQSEAYLQLASASSSSASPPGWLGGLGESKMQTKIITITMMNLTTSRLAEDRSRWRSSKTAYHRDGASGPKADFSPNRTRSV